MNPTGGIHAITTGNVMVNYSPSCAHGVTKQAIVNLTWGVRFAFCNKGHVSSCPFWVVSPVTCEACTLLGNFLCPLWEHTASIRGLWVKLSTPNFPYWARLGKGFLLIYGSDTLSH